MRGILAIINTHAYCGAQAIFSFGAIVLTIQIEYGIFFFPPLKYLIFEFNVI